MGVAASAIPELAIINLGSVVCFLTRGRHCLYYRQTSTLNASRCFYEGQEIRSSDLHKIFPLSRGSLHQWVSKWLRQFASIPPPSRAASFSFTPAVTNLAFAND